MVYYFPYVLKEGYTYIRQGWTFDETQAVHMVRKNCPAQVSQFVQTDGTITFWSQGKKVGYIKIQLCQTLNRKNQFCLPMPSLLSSRSQVRYGASNATGKPSVGQKI
jgi:hypothetical protein